MITSNSHTTETHCGKPPYSAQGKNAEASPKTRQQRISKGIADGRRRMGQSYAKDVRVF